MTDFESELVDLLDARAGRVDVRGDAFAGWIEGVGAEGGDDRLPERRRRTWLIAAAAALMVVFGVVGSMRGGGESEEVIVADNSEEPDDTEEPAETDEAEEPPFEPPAFESPGPLFVLPPDGFSTSPITGSTATADEPFAFESMVVGRRTDSGFTDLVLVEWTQERGFLGTTPFEIDGRTIEPSIDGNGLLAEQLTDGTWLRFTSWRNPDALESVVPATTVDDGRITFSDVAGLEVLSVSSPGPHATTTISVFGQQGPELILTVVAVDDGAEPLFFAAANDGDAERFSNGEVEGYFVRPSSASSFGELNAFSWRLSEQHVGSVLMPGSDDDVLELVNALRVVDEATWRAAVPAAG